MESTICFRSIKRGLLVGDTENHLLQSWRLLLWLYPSVVHVYMHVLKEYCPVLLLHSIHIALQSPLPAEDDCEINRGECSYNVPSVSRKITFPFAPCLYITHFHLSDMSVGSCAVTQRVCASWVFPVRNSPKISVILIVSIPPPRRVSSSELPVVILITF